MPNTPINIDFTIEDEITKISSLENAKEIVQKIESTSEAALNTFESYFIEKIALIISNVKNKEVVREIIDLLCENQEFNNKLANQLVSVLMDIAAEKAKEITTQVDLVRSPGRNSAEEALKRLFLKLLLTGETAITTYKPILYPYFASSLSVIIADLIRTAYIEKSFTPSKEEASELPPDEAYHLSNEAKNKLIEHIIDYQQTAADHGGPGFSKVWTSEMKEPFTGFYDSLGRLAPKQAEVMNSKNEEMDINNNAKNDNENKKTKKKYSTVLISLPTGQKISEPAWKIGQLATFATMIGTNALLDHWFEDLKTVLAGKKEDLEQFVFSDDTILKNSFDELLFDANFYDAYIDTLLTRLSKTTKKTIKIEESERNQFKNNFSNEYKSELLKRLNELEQNPLTSDEIKLMCDLKNLLTNYKNSIIPSSEFGSAFTLRLTQFKEKLIANKIKALLTNPTFKDLIKSINSLEFSFEEDKKDNEINALLNAILNNNPKALKVLPESEFKNNLQLFLNSWGASLASILNEDFKNKIFRGVLKIGFFKETISKKTQDEFKLPIAVSDIPQTIQGLLELTDKGLIEIFSNSTHDPKIKESFKVDKIKDLLSDPQNAVLSSLENFTPNFVNTSLTATIKKSFSKKFEATNEEKAIEEEINKRRKVLKKNLKSLSTVDDFKSKLKNIISDSDFNKILFFHPKIHSKYSPLSNYLLFQEFYDALSPFDKELIKNRGHMYNSKIYNAPTLKAASQIRAGGDLGEPPIPPSEHDNCLRKFTIVAENLGTDGQVKDHDGKLMDYTDALIRVDSSFVDFIKLSKEPKQTQNTAMSLKEPSSKYIAEYLSAIKSLLNQINNIDKVIADSNKVLSQQVDNADEEKKDQEKILSPESREQLLQKRELILQRALNFAIEINSKDNSNIVDILQKFKQKDEKLQLAQITYYFTLMINNDRVYSLNHILKFCYSSDNMLPADFNATIELVANMLTTKYDNNFTALKQSPFSKILRAQYMKENFKVIKVEAISSSKTSSSGATIDEKPRSISSAEDSNAGASQNIFKNSFKIALTNSLSNKDGLIDPVINGLKNLSDKEIIKGFKAASKSLSNQNINISNLDSIITWVEKKKCHLLKELIPILVKHNLDTISNKLQELKAKYISTPLVKSHSNPRMLTSAMN